VKFCKKNVLSQIFVQEKLKRYTFCGLTASCTNFMGRWCWWKKLWKNIFRSFFLLKLLWNYQKTVITGSIS